MVILKHFLLDIEAYDYLPTNPISGMPWEDFVIENIPTEYDLWKPSFVRTTNGAEIDLILERTGQRHFFECKLSKVPKPSRGFYELIDSMAPKSAWIVVLLKNLMKLEKESMFVLLLV